MTSTRLSRTELHHAAWSTPMKHLASRFGVSDVAVAKACRRAGIPLPGRGYWAKRAAGQRVRELPLLPRFPGAPEYVTVGGDHRYGDIGLTEAEILQPIPPPPHFEEPIDSVTKRAVALIGHLRIPRTFVSTHSAVEKALKEDEARAAKYAVFKLDWNEPLFRAAAGQRRLRFINGLFLGLASAGARPFFRDREGRELACGVGDELVSLELATVSANGKPSPGPPRAAKQRPNRLRLTISSWPGEIRDRPSWVDRETGRLESMVGEIAVNVLVAGELQHRAKCFRIHEWRVQRRAQLEEEDRKRRVEAERKERERVAKLERKRVEHLLKDAAALSQADQIRAYVAAVRLRIANSPSENGDLTLAEWAGWALAIADRLDPVTSGAFHRRMA